MRKTIGKVVLCVSGIFVILGVALCVLGMVGGADTDRVYRSFDMQWETRTRDRRRNNNQYYYENDNDINKFKIN